MATQRPVLALDLVDVVEDSWPHKRAWVLQRLGSDVGATPLSRTTLEALLTYRHGVVGYQTYDSMSREIATPRGILARPPVRGVVAALRRLHPHTGLVILSGRREEKRAVTERWLRRNGMEWLTGPGLQLFAYRPNLEREPSVESPKLRWCLDQGVDAYVDNQARQLAVADTSNASNLTRILFSSDPSDQRRLQGPVHVAKDWAACLAVLAEELCLPLMHQPAGGAICPEPGAQRLPGVPGRPGAQRSVLARTQPK